MAKPIVTRAGAALIVRARHHACLLMHQDVLDVSGHRGLADMAAARSDAASAGPAAFSRRIHGTRPLPASRAWLPAAQGFATKPLIVTGHVGQRRLPMPPGAGLR